MRMHSLLPAIFLLALLASCSEPSPQPEAPEVPEEIAPIEPPASTTFPTAIPEDAERDACLEGTWSMDTDFLDILVQNLVPVTNIYVPRGFLNLRLYSDGGFTYSGDLTIQINFAENWYMQGVGGFSDDGNYASEGDTILFDLQGTTTQVYKWIAYKDGQTVEQPGSEPEFGILLPSRAPYRCTSETLEIDTVNPARDTITMFFTRSR